VVSCCIIAIKSDDSYCCVVYPVVLVFKALYPIAVLYAPVVLEYKAVSPIAVLDAPVVLAYKARYPIAVLFVPVAEELKFVVAPIEIFVETFPPPLLTNKSLIEPVTPKDPVIKALPVYGNVVSGAYEALTAFVANEAVPCKEPVKEVAIKDPEIFTVFAAKSPFINGVPEPEAIYSLLLS
jgi:hypothetical protein